MTTEHGLIAAALSLLVIGQAHAIEWRTDLTTDQIRTTAWGQDARHVSSAMKARVYHRDGYTGAHDPRCPCEVDHIGPRCLGGADTMRNLQVQSYRGLWNAHMKDRVEDYACREFRSGVMSLPVARGMFDDWQKSYVVVFDLPMHRN